MFRLCPNCRAKLRPIRYKTRGMLRHYFECKCGWTNKPQEAGDQGSVTYACKTEVVENQSDSERTGEDSSEEATI